jgi:hypothetical protein
MPPEAVKTSFYVPPDLLEAAKAAAAEEQVTLRTWLTRIVERELKRLQRKTEAA